jgi:hypothetical protein
MVAHTRKTPGAGPLRSVKNGAVKNGAIKNGDAKNEAAKPEAVTPEPAVPGTVNQSLQFRSLNLPVLIEVVEDAMERPAAVALPPTISNRPTGSNRPARSRRPAQPNQIPTPARLAVTAINDLWQVDDEWWRERPISRRYYQITTQNDRRLTIFRDQVNGSWYWQKGG